MPRHSPYALFRLNSRLACSLFLLENKFQLFYCLSFANNCFLGCKLKTIWFIIHCLSPIRSLLCLTKLFLPLLVRKNLYFTNNKFFSIYNYLFRFFCLFGFQWTFESFAFAKSSFRLTTKDINHLQKLNSRFAREKQSKVLVGPSGLEPPTSCLSGTRSNLLSYEPMWLVSDWSHLNSFVLLFRTGGDDGIRTHDPLLAGQVLSQLSYTPIKYGL